MANPKEADCLECLGLAEEYGREAQARWNEVAGFTGEENT